MSWWPVPDSANDVSGDCPADAVDMALLGLARARGEVSHAKPSLPELLRAIEITLAQHGDLVENPPASPHIQNLDGLAASDDAPEDLREAVQGAISDIVKCFQEERERLPRVAEVLYAFTFVLDASPQRTLRPPFPACIDVVMR